MPRSQTLLIPLTFVAVGVGWLLSALGHLPEVDWWWILGIAVCGVAVLASGFDKATLVVGGWLLALAVCSFQRQRGAMTWDVEMPVLVIAFGVLLSLAFLPAVPKPHWWLERRIDAPQR